MGEPADNAEAVTQTTRILTTRELFQLAATKVTVSTVAPTPESFQKLKRRHVYWLGVYMLSVTNYENNWCPSRSIR